MIRRPHALRRRCALIAGDDGVAMVIAIFAILTVAALSTAVAGVVVGQVLPTKQIAARVDAVHAADAGIDAALALVRTAPSAGGARWNLPCHPEGSPLRGTVDGDRSRTFVVTFDYRTESGARSSCTARTVRYVDLTSTGAVAPSGTTVAQRRVLHQRYYLSLTDKLAVGGLIRSLYNQSRCIQVVGAAVGSRVTLEACNDNEPRQRFTYNKNYTLSVSSSPASSPQCLTLGTATIGGSQVVETTACADVQTQKWGFGSSPDIYLTLPYRCLRTSDGSQNTGVTMVGAGCWPYGGTTFGWSPDPAIGPGSITVDDTSDLHGAYLQWVDYLEFGRCLDVTGEDVNYGFLINYPCKQDPSGVPAKWNQRFTWNDNGALETYSPWGSYCITSRSTGGRVFMAPCDRSAAQRWTVNRSTDTATRYTVVDAWGHCLAPNEQDLFSGAFSIEQATSCDGTARQRWNAPPLTQDSNLLDLRESDPNS